MFLFFVFFSPSNNLQCKINSVGQRLPQFEKNQWEDEIRVGQNLEFMCKLKKITTQNLTLDLI